MQVPKHLSSVLATSNISNNRQVPRHLDSDLATSLIHNRQVPSHLSSDLATSLNFNGQVPYYLSSVLATSFIHNRQVTGHFTSGFGDYCCIIQQQASSKSSLYLLAWQLVSFRIRQVLCTYTVAVFIVQ